MSGSLDSRHDVRLQGIKRSRRWRICLCRMPCSQACDSHCEELMAKPKSTTPIIIVKQLKISSTGVLGTISPLPTVVTCRLSTALSRTSQAVIFQRVAAI